MKIDNKEVFVWIEQQRVKYNRVGNHHVQNVLETIKFVFKELEQIQGDNQILKLQLNARRATHNTIEKERVIKMLVDACKENPFKEGTENYNLVEAERNQALEEYEKLND